MPRLWEWQLRGFKVELEIHLSMEAAVKPALIQLATVT